MVAGKAAPSETEQAKVEVKPGDLLKLSLSLDLHEAGGLFYPPAQEATAVKLRRNAQWVSSEALAKEDTLRRVLPKTQKGPRLVSRGALPSLQEFLDRLCRPCQNRMVSFFNDRSLNQIRILDHQIK